MSQVGETRFQGTTMLLEWDQARSLTSRKERVRRKGKSLHLKSNASYVTVHIRHELSKKEGAQCHDRGGGIGRRSTYGLNAAIECFPSQPKA